MSLRFPQPPRRHRASLGLAVLTMAVLAACGPDIHVRTAVSPEASTLAGRRTFRIVEASEEQNGNGYGLHDPMIDNAITSMAVHDQIKAAFEARGYRYSPDNADFELTFKATIAPILDVRTYNLGGHGYYGPYGYDAFCCTAYGGGYGYAVAQYDHSTVIIDAVDPGTRKLLWRAQGTSGLYAEPKRYMKELRHAVRAIAKKFPPAGGVPLTASR